MNRRRRIRESFREIFRYRIPPGPARPGTGNPAAINPADIVAEPISRSEAAAELRAQAADKFGRVPDSLRIIVQDSRGNFWRLTVGAGAGEGATSPLTAEDHMMDPHLVAMAQAETPNASTNAAQASGPLWVRIPEGQGAQQVLQNVMRILSPSGQLTQDGLRALLNSPQLQALFQGGQLTRGAAQMLPQQQLVGILIPPSLLAANPEAAKALLVAQGLPPQLIHSIPDRAIAGALQALLQTSQEAGTNPLHFLQTVASALTLAGTPVQEVQNLLIHLLQAARNQGLTGQHGVSAEQLQQLTAKLMAANNPQLLGLNQLVQENFGQGLTQIFNSFIRVFLGGALMQSQQQWPQAVPNEKLLAELGGLFGAFAGKDVQKKPERSRSKKQGRKELKIDDPAFQRVERKEDLGDEHREHEAEMASIFIDMDDN
ncbi:MAG: hypothetical protein U1F66_06050 [bacterium]